MTGKQPFWHDYSYTTGRGKPVAVTHCQQHHDRTIALRRDGAERPGYSVKFRPSERGKCLTCGASTHGRQS